MAWTKVQKGAMNIQVVTLVFKNASDKKVILQPSSYTLKTYPEEIAASIFSMIG